MNKISFPEQCVNMQKVSKNSDGTISRDRLIILCRENNIEIVDPEARSAAISQLAQRNLDRATAEGAVQAMIWSSIIIFFGIPFGIYVGLVYF